MTSVQLRDLPSACYTLPDGPAAQNAVALFIFTIPMGTLSQDLFVNPIYRSVRNTIAKRCHCDLAVFDGNTMLQRSHSGPKSVRSRVRNANGNASMGGDVSQTCASLLINITNTHEQVLFARGNWLIQVNYLTEPSEHHLFLKLVNDFATRLNSSGGFKRGAGSPLISQGFKCTTLVAITHEKLRQIWQCNSLFPPDHHHHHPQHQQQEVTSSGEKQKNQPLGRQPQQKPLLKVKNPNLPCEWGEFPSLEQFQSMEDLQTNISSQNRNKGIKTTPTVILFQNNIEENTAMYGKPYQGGDPFPGDFQKYGRVTYQEHEEGRIPPFEGIVSLLRPPADHNFNHHVSEELALSCIECAHHLNALEAEEQKEEEEDDEIEVLFREEFEGEPVCTLEQEVEELDSVVDMEYN